MQRSCMVCRKRADKAQLLRLVLDEAGEVWPDVLQKAPGRGAYVCYRGSCVQRLHERQLLRAWKGRAVAEGQAGELYGKALQAMQQLCRQAVQRQRRLLAVGRDAVMHRMWDKAGVLVLLAGNAGEALRRQIEDACEKRRATGLQTTLVIFADSATLADIAQRDVVSVLAVEDSPASAGLRQHCLHYGQLRETE